MHLKNTCFFLISALFFLSFSCKKQAFKYPFNHISVISIDTVIALHANHLRYTDNKIRYYVFDSVYRNVQRKTGFRISSLEVGLFVLLDLKLYGIDGTQSLELVDSLAFLFNDAFIFKDSCSQDEPYSPIFFSFADEEVNILKGSFKEKRPEIINIALKPDSIYNSIYKYRLVIDFVYLTNGSYYLYQ